MNEKYLNSYGRRMDRERYCVSPTPTMRPNMAIKIGVNKKEINAKTTSCATGNRVTATANGKKYLCFYNDGSWSGTQI